MQDARRDPIGSFSESFDGPPPEVKIFPSYRLGDFVKHGSRKGRICGIRGTFETYGTTLQSNIELQIAVKNRPRYWAQEGKILPV